MNIAGIYLIKIRVPNVNASAAPISSYRNAGNFKIGNPRVVCSPGYIQAVVYVVRKQSCYKASHIDLHIVYEEV